MIKLNLDLTPKWHDLLPGVKILLKPLTTTLMVAARSDPEVEQLPESATNEERAIVFAKAIARRAIIDWDGIVGDGGDKVEVTAQAIDAVIDIWPVFEAFQLQYVSKGLLLEQEKNSYSPLLSGTTAVGANTVQHVGKSNAASAQQE